MELTCLIPPSELISSSRGFEIRLSISSGPAPRYGVDTETTGKLTSGNWSMPSLPMQSTPTTSNNATTQTMSVGRRGDRAAMPPPATGATSRGLFRIVETRLGLEQQPLHPQPEAVHPGLTVVLFELEQL